MSYGSPYHHPGNYQERDGCITVFLLGLGAIHILYLAFICFGLTLVSVDGFLGFFVLVEIGLVIATLSGIIALWNWKRWGYTLLMTLYVISIILAIISADVNSALIRLLLLGLLYLLYRDRMEALE